MRRRMLAPGVLALVLTVAAAPPGSATPTLSKDATIAATLSQRLMDPSLGTTVGIGVVDIGAPTSIGPLDTGSATYVLGRGYYTPFMPASNEKLVTAVAALHVLGPTRRFTTKVSALPGITAHITDVFLVGGGDPMLSSAGLSLLAQRTATALQARAAALPSGTPFPSVHVYVDDTLFPPPTLAPGWLSSDVPYSVDPVLALARYGYWAKDNAIAAGTYFTLQLAAYLHTKAVANMGRAPTPSGAQVVTSVVGSQVVAMVRQMLRNSDNDIAETLFRQVALASGLPPTWTGGRIAAGRVLAALRVPMTGLVLADGSGMSRYDRLTPVAVTVLLRAIVDRYHHPELASIFWGRSLPTAGLTGTLAASTGRFQTWPSTCAVSRVVAKTGTLDAASSLSGVAISTDGRLRVFSILVNRRPLTYPIAAVRRAEDALAAAIAC